MVAGLLVYRDVIGPHRTAAKKRARKFTADSTTFSSDDVMRSSGDALNELWREENGNLAK